MRIDVARKLASGHGRIFSNGEMADGHLCVLVDNPSISSVLPGLRTYWPDECKPTKGRYEWEAIA